MSVMAARAPAGYLDRPIRPVARLLTGLTDERPEGLHAHERRFGPLPLPPVAWTADAAAARRAASRLIDVVDRAGLTGRGGAGFPTGRKLRSVASGSGPAVVVANGSEGEPAHALTDTRIYVR